MPRTAIPSATKTGESRANLLFEIFRPPNMRALHFWNGKLRPPTGLHFPDRCAISLPACRHAANSISLSLIVLEDDAAVGVDFSVDCAWIRKRALKTTRSWLEICILYLLHVVPSLSERRDAVSPINSPLSRIVRRQGQFQVAIVSFQQPL